MAELGDMRDSTLPEVLSEYLRTPAETTKYYLFRATSLLGQRGLAHAARRLCAAVRKAARERSNAIGCLMADVLGGGRGHGGGGKTSDHNTEGEDTDSKFHF